MDNKERQIKFAIATAFGVVAYEHEITLSIKDDSFTICIPKIIDSHGFYEYVSLSGNIYVYSEGKLLTKIYIDSIPDVYPSRASIAAAVRKAYNNDKELDVKVFLGNYETGSNYGTYLYDPTAEEIIIFDETGRELLTTNYNPLESNIDLDTLDRRQFATYVKVIKPFLETGEIKTIDEVKEDITQIEKFILMIRIKDALKNNDAQKAVEIFNDADYDSQNLFVKELIEWLDEATFNN